MFNFTNMSGHNLGWCGSWALDKAKKKDCKEGYGIYVQLTGLDR